MSTNLSWSPLPYTIEGELSFWAGAILTAIACVLSPFGGFVLFVFTLPLLGVGWYLKDKNQKQTAVVQTTRKATQESTNSVMMSRAKYVGGHPLIAETQSVVIGLSDKNFTIFEFIKPESYIIQPKVSIPLSSIEKTSTGRPRTAHEIFDEDDRRVIDVVEGSPFLQLGFQLDGQKYAVSLSDFEIGTPIDWGNHIISLRHVLITSHEDDKPQT